MACKSSCQCCDRMIISQEVTFANGKLIINIPDGTYQNGCKYCLVVAQAIPATATITAPVVITIEDGPVEYPLTSPDCTQVIACALRTRWRYSTCVHTSATGGTFRLLGRASCSPNYRLSGIDGTAPTVGGGTA